MIKRKLNQIKNSSIRKIFSDVDAEEVTDLVNEEVNEEDFSEAEGELSTEEVEKVLQTIAGIADAVLEVQGAPATTEMDYSEVLDLVDELVTEPEETEEEIAAKEEEDEAIESSVINLTLANDGQTETLDIITATGDDTIDTIVGADDPEELIVPAPIEAEPEADIAVVSSRKASLKNAKTYKVAINSHWKDIDLFHQKAWDMAEEKAQASGKTPEMGAKYYGMVMALAKTYYNRLMNNPAIDEAATLGSAKIQRVLSALKKEAEDEAYYWGDTTDEGYVNIYTKDEYREKFGEDPDEGSRVESSMIHRRISSDEELYYSYGDNGLEFVTKEEYKKIYGEDPDESSRVDSSLCFIRSSEEEDLYCSYGDDGLEFVTKEEYKKIYGKDPDEGSKISSAKWRIAMNYIKSHRRAHIIASDSGPVIMPKLVEKPVASEGTDGNMSGIEDEGLLSDAGSDSGQLSGDVEGSSKSEQETDALGEPVDFNSTITEEISLPDIDGATALLKFTKVSNSISVLSSRTNENWSHLYGRVKPLTNGKGIVFLKSNLLNLVAIRGTFQKGIKNSRYTAFAKTAAGYVNSTGAVFSSKAGTPFLIASSTSNHSSRKTTAVDSVAILERAFVKSLKSQLAQNKRQSAYYNTVSEKRRLFARKVLSQALSTEKQLSSAKRQNTSLVKQVRDIRHKMSNSVDSALELKRQLSEQAYLEELNARDNAINANKTPEKVNGNIDYLSSIM